MVGSSDCRMERLRRGGPSASPTIRLSVALLVAACDPATTRPPFFPFPESPSAILDARPQRVLPEAAAWLTGQGLTIERSSVQDLFLETAWYDTRTHRSTTGSGAGVDLERAVKVRCWVDPDATGRSKLTVEVVYRPRWDPSQDERDLEQVVPEDHSGQQLMTGLLEAMKKRFGPAVTAPTPSPTPPSPPSPAPR